jgi:hypothetical protein
VLGLSVFQRLSLRGRVRDITPCPMGCFTGPDFLGGMNWPKSSIDHILNLAMNISNAPSGYLYGSKKRGKFKLLSYRGSGRRAERKN